MLAAELGHSHLGHSTKQQVLHPLCCNHKNNDRCWNAVLWQEGNCFERDDAPFLVEHLREMRKTNVRPHAGAGAKAQSMHGIGEDVKKTGTSRRRLIVGTYSSNDPSPRLLQMDRSQFMDWAEATLASRLGVSSVHREDGNV